MTKNLKTSFKYLNLIIIIIWNDFIKRVKIIFCCEKKKYRWCGAVDNLDQVCLCASFESSSISIEPMIIISTLKDIIKFRVSLDKQIFLSVFRSTTTKTVLNCIVKKHSFSNRAERATYRPLALSVPISSFELLTRLVKILFKHFWFQICFWK